MIPREIIDEIVYRSDIEQVISSYVTLKRAGSNCNGLCPFHSERTPSFTVFPNTRSFYCFGCGAGGDVITFIMRAENLSYVDAVRWLGDRAGIPVPEDEYTGEVDTVSRKRIYEMNLEAARFFRDRLFDDKYGKEAMSYLRDNRKLSGATIKHFGLGFSPNSFGALTDHMKKLGYTDEELVIGFLGGKSKKTGNVYDYYRNRIIFPIIDTSGNIVAFGGRVMDDSKPKYLNTSDTPAFKKSRHLFALNFARKHAEEYMILCEGYMDVIALHAAGFENAVATLGTAITSEQARVFAKYTKKVIICYDSDEAGQNAASKAMRLLNEAGLEVKVLSVVGAKDPDEFIKKYGAEKFKSLLGESKSGFDFKLEKIVGKYNLALPEDKIKASSEVCELIAVVGSEVERDIYIKRAADVLGNNTDAMKNDVERVRYRKIKEYKKKEGRDAQLSVKNIGDRVNLESSKNIRASNSEEAVIALMLIYDEFRQDAANGQAGITPNDFVTDFGRRVFEEICKIQNSEGGFSKALLGQSFSVEEMGRIEKLEVERRRLAKNDKEVFLSCIESIKQEKNALLLSDGFDDLKARQEMLRKAKERKDPKISGIK